jgi:hypothetical protein
MALVLADRVRENTNTAGTGTVTLTGAVTGFASFAEQIGDGNTTYYTITDATSWEVGVGTYSANTLSRDTVLDSSNAGAKINFAIGLKDVFVTLPAEKSVNQDENNRVLIPYTSGTTNVGSLNVGNATAHADSGVIAGFTASEPLYLYTSLQNTSASNTSYASYAVNDGGHTAYGELGINNANYSYSAAGFPNNGFSTPLASFVESFGGPLVLGSWDSQKISFIVNGAVNTADAMTIETTGAVTIPTAAVTGGTINGTTVGATTASTGAFTTLSASSTVSGTGFSTYLASPPAIGGTAASTGRFTTVTSTVATGTAPFTVASTTAVANLSIGGNAGTVTNGVYATDTGTVTNTMLAGSIANAKLTNSSITFGSTAQALGSTVSAISGVTIDNGAIGGTTPAAGTFTTLIGGGGSANYEQIIGGAAGKAVQFQSLGSDAAVSLAIQSKGTGAIDLAAGSSGVNISNGGTVTAITRTNGGTGYTVAPTVVISAPTTAGGVQATATCTVTAGVVDTSFSITNAGSGYVEQPTITFTPVSGGSGAAAYATVGAIPTVKTLGSAISFATPSSEVLRIADANPTAQNYLSLESSGGGSVFRTAGAGANPGLSLVTKGSGAISFSTNASTTNIQLSVSNTASAVNYVQVTGGVTGNPATVTTSAQGSDANVNMRLTPKGTGTLLTATAATILDGTAIPAGGTAGAGYKLSSTANFGIFFGSGAPTLAAAKGSLYMRSDGSSIATRMYINTDGSTTWTNVVTAA